ncbi:MAG: hypothetical protein A2W91_09355 [Bacteroidetes bacterium GWF2_38_335]|nr:MAG: hypothetical protein A2W91_09355 [Bacteroidetes bacterium GWF2_38_335]OFY80824.1 MAG: hypothetical protein A2281_09145 [Bacteroidetes bacterium RIFOXYA12_FULL_38_20]
MSLLVIENLSKIYKSKKKTIHALDNISLEVEKGDFVTITGPSGSGKTTLLLTLAGMIKPSSGKISFNDFHIEKASDRRLAGYRKKNVGFVMQSFALIPYLTALQNVMVPLSLVNSRSSIQKSKAKKVLEMVGLEDRIYHLPKELSAGQQQRVAIARALINNPSVIFADEPTGNLDPALSGEILKTFKEINSNQKITILMVTHSPQAAEYGNKNIRLCDGKLI